jgi:hypothetical protein
MTAKTKKPAKAGFFVVSWQLSRRRREVIPVARHTVPQSQGQKY